MSILAGIISIAEKHSITDEQRSRLRQTLSRSAHDGLYEWSDQRAYFVKANVGALCGDPGIVDDARGLSMVAGELLLEDAAGCCATDRLSELSHLHGAWAKSEWRVTASATGTFCAMHYCARGPKWRVALISDSLGVRPLYYYRDEECLVFASAMRVLEALPWVPKTFDIRGVSESLAFGYPLGDRTVYRGVHVVREAEVLCLSSEGETRHCYWRWDEVGLSSGSGDELAGDAYAEFSGAVSRRLQGEKIVRAFLSGGMDSRAIVAALYERGIQVDLLNASDPESQDREYARGFARECGYALRELDRPKGCVGIEFFKLLMSLGAETAREDEGSMRRPHAIWSGDGGSVGVGAVYLREDAVSELRSGDLGRAVDLYLAGNRIGLPLRVLSKQYGPRVIEALRAAVVTEVGRWHCEDSAQKLYLFLMTNDQRRHLAMLYEEMDIYRVDYILPFFDRRFMLSIMRIPLEYRLYHRFYTNWLRCFPKVATSTPWQTYPGHVPCPVAGPTGLGYQWERGERAARVQAPATRAREALPALWASLAGGLTSPLVRRPVLLSYAVAHLLGVDNFEHVLKGGVRYLESRPLGLEDL